jgi:hypothetical protein
VNTAFKEAKSILKEFCLQAEEITRSTSHYFGFCKNQQSPSSTMPPWFWPNVPSGSTYRCQGTLCATNSAPNLHCSLSLEPSKDSDYLSTQDLSRPMASMLMSPTVSTRMHTLRHYLHIEKSAHITILSSTFLANGKHPKPSLQTCRRRV